MKPTTIKAIGGIVIPVAIAVGLFLLYKKFFGKGKSFSLNNYFNPEELKAVEGSMTSKMACGKTYGQAANEIFQMMWGNSKWAGFVKNTDEKALGEYLLNYVRREEFSMLNAAYIVTKSEKASYRYSYTLMDDLKFTFNSKEQKRYLAHLT